MHWFESKVSQLVQLADGYSRLHNKEANSKSEFSREPDIQRDKFILNLNNLVEDVSDQPGIMACLVSYDGLLLAKAGSAPDFEALAALTQECLQPAAKASKILALGEMQQMVLIGTEYKLAVITVGAMALCVLSPRSTSMSNSLRNKVNEP